MNNLFQCQFVNAFDTEGMMTFAGIKKYPKMYLLLIMFNFILQ